MSQHAAPNGSHIFFEALYNYGDAPPGYLVLWQKDKANAKKNYTACGRAYNWARAAEIALENRDQNHVYFGIGLQGKQLISGYRKTRGKIEDVIAIPGFWFDLDFKDDGENRHAKDSLPESYEDAKRLIDEFPLPPTLTVHSGHGVQLYWLFHELWEFETEEERSEVEKMVGRFQTTLIRQGAAKGWKLDNTSDLARVFRVPGTLNHKSDPPVEARILEYVENRRYTPDDFDPYLIDEEYLDPPEADFDNPEYPEAKVENIVHGCAWIRHCRDDAASLSEPEWYAMLSIVPRCEGGRDIAHEWSKPYSGYNVQETDAKIAHAMQASGPRTCADIESIAGDQYCKGCTYKGLIKSPINLGTKNTKEPKRPRILATNGDLVQITSQAWDALMLFNNDHPSHKMLFQRGGMINWILQSDEGEPYLARVDQENLRSVLASRAWWYRWNKTEERAVDTFPPYDVVKSMIADPDKPLPVISRIVEAPVFGVNGELKLETGYHEESRTYYWDTGLELPNTNFLSSVQRKEVKRALDFLLDEYLGDFPFASESERTHALAAMFAPFARELINGPTPLHLIEAPTPGTGKSLLADAIAIPATGSPPTIMIEGSDDEEWRKRITSTLMGGPTFVLIDNVRSRLDSASLAIVLTTKTWQDRILGRSEVVSVPMRTVWLATGNNPYLSQEISRRTIRIRLDAKTARPWKRTGFKHNDLRGWAYRNRSKIVYSILTIISAWVRAGMPKGDDVLGQYESWASIMGGIMTFCGANGFLQNLEDMYESNDEETGEWEEFVAKWWELYENAAMSAQQLFEIAQDHDMLLWTRGSRSIQSQKMRLARRVARMRDQQVGGFEIRVEKDRVAKSNLYRLFPIDEEPY